MDKAKRARVNETSRAEVEIALRLVNRSVSRSTERRENSTTERST